MQQTTPQTKPFLVVFGNADDPRMVMEVFAENQQRAGEQADCLAELGERVDVIPLRSFAEEIKARTAAAWLGGKAHG